VLDPPSYSTTKARRFVAKSDYAELAALAFGLLKPHGRLLASSNHRGIPEKRFRKLIFDAARTANVEVTQVKDLATPSDFPPPPEGESHLKAVLATLA
jgi:23S rRNA (cytosine1962-C5)-methyltransferase